MELSEIKTQDLFLELLTREDREKVLSPFIEDIKRNNNTARPRGTDSAKVIQVIVTEALEGIGTDDDPCRIQRRYWSLDGELLANGI